MSFLPGQIRADHQQERWPNDWYVEPVFAVEALFDSVEFDGLIHDPACGGGTIPKIANTRGYIATGSDLVNRGYGLGDVNFLAWSMPFDNMICNPPYNLATEFALHAMKVVRRKVALIVRISFLCGQARRAALFDPYPPATVVVMSARPSMLPGGTDIPAKGGTADYCWIVWDRNHIGPTTMLWAVRGRGNGI